MRISKHFLTYAGRFALVHVLVYAAIALLFLVFQNLLPSTNRVALEFFRPYSIDPIILMGQAVRGLILAALLYPFYSVLVQQARGWLYLFGALWGLALFGAVEPIPGSIEGVIYTETTIVEHLLVLGAGAIQALIFCLLFLRWQHRAEDMARPTHAMPQPHRWRGFTLRFTLLHVVSYTLVGIIFMLLQDYAAAFESQPQFELFRPLDDPMVGAALPIQIVRGALLALFLYPFYAVFMRPRHGWLWIFSLIFGLTALGSAILIPEVVTLIAEGGAFAQFVEFGLPEVFVQMLIFSWLLFIWERRSLQKAEAQSATAGTATDGTTADGTMATGAATAGTNKSAAPT